MEKDLLYTKFGIHIKCQNLQASIKFYKALGFQECFAYGNKRHLRKLSQNIPTAPETYNGVVFEVGNSLLEIADGHIAVKSEVFNETITSSKISAMVHVTSLSKIEQLCSKHNIRIVVSRREFPWGTVELVLKDPDGFVLVFIERLKK